ncbi:MAG: hypothetical protein ACI4JA_11295 [Oscillospiraceae bacterium]
MANNKEYIHPAQERQDNHEKKRQKKKKKKGFVFLLIIILLLIALLMLMNYLGLGFGGGKGDGGESKASASSAAAESSVPDESSQAEKTAVTVKISGSSYIYGDKVYTLDEFRQVASVMDKDSVIIELADDNAVANAVENMHSLLDELELSYSDKPYESESSQPDSLSDDSADYGEIFE